MTDKTYLEEAQKLQKELQQRYPDRNIVIEESIVQTAWLPAWGKPPAKFEMQDGEPDSNGYLPAITRTCSVVEKYTCEYGKEHTTKAIGEMHSCNCGQVEHTQEPYKSFPTEWELRGSRTGE